VDQHGSWNPWHGSNASDETLVVMRNPKLAARSARRPTACSTTPPTRPWPSWVPSARRDWPAPCASRSACPGRSPRPPSRRSTSPEVDLGEEGAHLERPPTRGDVDAEKRERLGCGGAAERAATERGHVSQQVNGLLLMGEPRKRPFQMFIVLAGRSLGCGATRPTTHLGCSRRGTEGQEHPLRAGRRTRGSCTVHGRPAANVVYPPAVSLCGLVRASARERRIVQLREISHALRLELGKQVVGAEVHLESDSRTPSPNA